MYILNNTIIDKIIESKLTSTPSIGAHQLANLAGALDRKHR